MPSPQVRYLVNTALAALAVIAPLSSSAAAFARGAVAPHELLAALPDKAQFPGYAFSHYPRQDPFYEGGSGSCDGRAWPAGTVSVGTELRTIKRDGTRLQITRVFVQVLQLKDSATAHAEFSDTRGRADKCRQDGDPDNGVYVFPRLAVSSAPVLPGATHAFQARLIGRDPQTGRRGGGDSRAVVYLSGRHEVLVQPVREVRIDDNGNIRTTSIDNTFIRSLGDSAALFSLEHLPR